MSFYEERVLPWLMDRGLDTRRMAKERAALLAGIRGDVLEIGFGSGLNLPHYPAEVIRVVGVEPNERARRLAGRRIAAAPFPVELISLGGETLDVPDGAFDAAVSTFTLCTIPDVERALARLARALKPGGSLYFLEHGLSDDPGLQRWQQRWNPCQRTLFGGCHVNRRIDRLVSEPFEIIALDNYHLPGPKVATYIFRGRAVPRPRPSRCR